MNLPRILCPVSNCHFNGTFKGMKEHLMNGHNQMLWANFVILYDDYKTYPNYNILNISDSDEFYLWIQNTLIIKCTVKKGHNKCLIVNTKFNDTNVDIKSITVVVTNNYDKNFQQFCLHFIDEANYIEIKLLPIRLHFILNY